MKLGLEVEYWVVDERGRPCDGRDLVDAHERAKPEFVGPLLEIQTSPHGSVRSLGRELRETLRTVLEAAEESGRHLVPLGTPLSELSAPATTRRGELFEEIYGEGVASAKNCAGTHLHFEQGNVERQLDLLTALDPAVALVSSSPYYLGTRTVDCARADAYRRRCGRRFRRYCDLQPYVEGEDEWDRRVERDFERFVEIAAERGVPREEVEAHFSPEDAVLAPVRLRRSLPTVEWRAPDAALPSQLLQLAADVAALMAQTDRKPIERGEPGVLADRIRVPPFERLRGVSDEAVRWGLGSVRVREYLDALGFDPRAYRPLSMQLSGPGELYEGEARRMRLDCAARLRADVERLAERGVVEPEPAGAPYLYA
ncbi:glutamate-cysteine ligase family protein [Halegenticoccus tardaugens]|uniref:glutamate-cysteine ligase family protein n=1 Tax=Halegenticoccus tardaugens TaxID=2071624 RepID=UPI00100B0BA7|nr:glutamate-cysteine ligase family protein [Halegenticoccus tardaugens]